MKSKLLSKNQRNRLQYRNVRLLNSSRDTYGLAVQLYFKYIVGLNYQMHGCADGLADISACG